MIAEQCKLQEIDRSSKRVEYKLGYLGYKGLLLSNCKIVEPSTELIQLSILIG